MESTLRQAARRIAPGAASKRRKLAPDASLGRMAHRDGAPRSHSTRRRRPYMLSVASIGDGMPAAAWPQLFNDGRGRRSNNLSASSKATCSAGAAPALAAARGACNRKAAVVAPTAGAASVAPGRSPRAQPPNERLGVPPCPSAVQQANYHERPAPPVPSGMRTRASPHSAGKEPRLASWRVRSAAARAAGGAPRGGFARRHPGRRRCAEHG